MDISRILITTDFSDESDTAFDQGITSASHTGADVVLAFCTPDRDPGSRHDFDRLWGKDRYREAMRRRMQRYQEALDTLAGCAARRGVEIDTRIIPDFPDTGIAKAATELRADLVVVGTHGQGRFERALVGSTTLRVLRQSEVSVLVARPLGHEGGFRRVLVPTDFSASADRAVDAALTVTAADGAIDFVHFWQAPPELLGPFSPPDPELAGLRGALAAAAERDGVALTAKAASGPIRVSYTHVEDKPVPGIQAHLTGSDYDLVVVGSHGRRGLRRFILGSVAEATAMHAPCSVLVAR